MGSAVSYPTHADVVMKNQVLAIDLTFTILAVISVVFRFWARLKSAAGIGLDDWLSLGGLLILFINLALNLIMVVNGLGLQASELTAGNLTWIAKAIFGDEIVYIVNLALIKISILLMYCRVFALRRFRVGAWIIGIITCCWTLIFVFLILFQCHPIAKAWDPLLSGHCWNMRGTFIGNAVPNIVTDVVILVMPIYNIWKLHIRMVQRISLLGIFFLGCFVIVASIYRLVQVLQLDQNNLSYTLKNPTTWSHVEVSTALISACLPTMRPLLTSFMRVIGMGSQVGTSHSASRTPGIPATYSGTFPAPSKFKAWPEAKNISNDEIPLNSIKVETDMQVVESGNWHHGV
ncbi:hypothetical protein DTO166G4_6978 [Paecilomyces variotii]|uniref:Rhodopsin domain-containing protein n=1 Tax=Byssochlamys spectabilis TaxID=264951 RepID=A0A443HYG7_BYSSP|nr:hypothetical protein C8Q69DRAFT_461196 [Paecilomyces variotii]KAJ9204731.1 hypothetical protein DTO164E3_1906 [Paecilomyces variotii]KAJ9208574.1 hypothetical protein DTO032I3_551 [Paecilomyces variotii]KAJ9211464.1 hypothetical protein DTO166G4_6978 [Paecilomyces variotii]KAJ9231271.1 hypothetical protein DTO166G5_6893 [Paecilomyces variotii]KAJ9249500.1 hypothetical protein DTO207G8_6632 [Paecilomyces variotii]